MTKKQFKTTDNKGRESVWEWEETPEVIEAVKKLHQTVQPDFEDLSEGLHKLEASAPDYGVGK